MIVGSFGYSLRRRKLIKVGNPLKLLRVHERMAWAGALLVLVHGGIHFNALLPWLAIAAMLVNVASGLSGKFLLERSRKRLDQSRQQLREEGVVEHELEERLYWDSLTFAAVRQWRRVHFPIALAFATLAIAHLITIFLFWGWK